MVRLRARAAPAYAGLRTAYAVLRAHKHLWALLAFIRRMPDEQPELIIIPRPPRGACPGEGREVVSCGLPGIPVLASRSPLKKKAVEEKSFNRRNDRTGKGLMAITKE